MSSAPKDRQILVRFEEVHPVSICDETDHSYPTLQCFYFESKAMWGKVIVDADEDGCIETNTFVMIDKDFNYFDRDLPTPIAWKEDTDR